jgi:hypothetical protein
MNNNFAETAMPLIEMEIRVSRVFPERSFCLGIEFD